ncbi:endonuclease/exonuclease/phosphatase family protein [Nocardia yamanashiensis]|uniref:endonuclease/exonuclease/phosphatase family protein n=1 Tax=Nocardia yamanashiensis TaxID=209247 RepID=UPI001E5F562C|nr:endonuclease/exonuclease/phosphatase family protein [Nocardia yamanashiensis]UGT42244.1 endonuclease/exonuclease/phosphatase family protein [Nocardia yamanashiensis]
MTLNVWNDQGDSGARIGVINAGLRRLEPDLVALQEVLSTEHAARLLAGTGLRVTHQEEVMGVRAPGVETYGGNAVGVRFPHRVVEALDLRGVGAPDVPWGTLAVTVGVPGVGELLFIAPTTAFRLEAEAEREREVLALSDLESRHRRELPTVIAGDFNAGPEAGSMRYLTGKQSLSGRSTWFHDAWEIAGAGDGFTWSDENPNAAADIGYLARQPRHRRRIDYVLVGAPWAHPKAYARVRAAELVFDAPGDGVWASDHFGVLADLDIGLLG